jgi:PAS domain S-box-containing protein
MLFISNWSPYNQLAMKLSVIKIHKIKSKQKTPESILKEKLISSELRYRRLFESAKDGILILDTATGKIIDANPFLINLLGFTKEEFIEKEIWQIGLFRDIAANKEKFHELQQQEYVRYENLPLETADGRKINVEFVSNVYLENHKKIIQCNIRDITERKKKENALIDSELRRRTLLQTIPDLIWLKDLDGKYLSCNTMFERFFGAREAEIIGKTDYDFIDKELADFFRENDRKAMLAGKPVSNEEWISFAEDGHSVYLETIKAPMFDSQNKIIGILGIGRDITARINSEKELRQSEEKFRSYIDNAPDGVFVVDETGRYTDVNIAACKMSGYSADELLKMSITDLLPEESLEQGLYQFKHLIQYGTSDADLLFKQKDGLKRWWSLEGVKLTETRYLGFTKDISRRKLAEELLRESEERLRMTLEETQIGTFDWDIKNDVYYVSNTYFTMLGYLPKKGFAGRDEWLKRVHPDDKEIIEEKIHKILNGLESKYEYETRIKHADGNYRWIYVIGRIIKWDEDNKPVRLIGVRIDITKRKFAEKELIAAKEKAEESDILKTAFLANMSHEIRTPMNGILGFTELLKEPMLTGEEQKEYIDIIEKSGARMLNIINNIVSMSKIESGQMEISLSDTDINEMVEYVLNFFKPEAEKKNLQISCKNPLPSQKTIIKTDREKVTAILINLVENAIKFTTSGFIKFGYEKKAGCLEFFVTDTGIGVKPEQKELIFERFRQGSESLSRNYEGAGLGLSISKAYVELLGGKIWVDDYSDNALSNEPGNRKGSIFHVTIPDFSVQQVNIAGFADKLNNSIESHIKNLKILIAEDDENSQAFISIATRKFCKEMIKVDNGIKAVEACRLNQDIDLVLMDIKMPEMDGYEATRQIRKFNKKVIIIAQTGFALAGDREKAIKAGCNEYIAKPLNLAELNNLIKKHFT